MAHSIQKPKCAANTNQEKDLQQNGDQFCADGQPNSHEQTDKQAGHRSQQGGNQHFQYIMGADRMPDIVIHSAQDKSHHCNQQLHRQAVEPQQHIIRRNRLQRQFVPHKQTKPTGQGDQQAVHQDQKGNAKSFQNRSHSDSKGYICMRYFVIRDRAFRSSMVTADVPSFFPISSMAGFRSGLR